MTTRGTPWNLGTVIHDDWMRAASPIFGKLHMAVCQNLVPLVNIKIAGKWMLIPLKMILIGIDPYPYDYMKLLLSP